MFIAKMRTKYPDYHGRGYYNFIMEGDQESLDSKIEEYSHDFSHIKTVKTRHKSAAGLIGQYPNKSELNDKYFKDEEK